MRQNALSIVGLLRGTKKTEAQGRLGEREPVAIIDIGSNSVRQVIYEGLTRSPSILFNEKILCGLGKGVANDGKLSSQDADRAYNAIVRFLELGKQNGVVDTHILATAAVREAKNGEAFVKRIEKNLGVSVKLLSGEEEAEYATMGVKSGFNKPKGIVGDQGGGSMELTALNGSIKNGVTTPLGVLRLQENTKSKPSDAQKTARKKLSNIEIKWPGKSRKFYAIGGTWRSLAKLHMMQNNYLLNVIHDYTVDADAYKKFCKSIVETNLDKIDCIDEISKSRRSLLPYGAAVMAEIIDRFDVKSVTHSASGLREGYLFSLLDEEEQKEDALLEATAELAILRARSPHHSIELADWTEKAFKVLKIKETDSQKRWRIAACNLADIAWRSSSDYRAEQTLGIINNAGFNSISHEGRAYLAISNFHRYKGLSPKKQPPEFTKFASDETRERARILAAFFRVLYLFSASTIGVLPSITFERSPYGNLIIGLPEDRKVLIGEVPKQRIEHLARELGEEISIAIQ